MALGFIFKVGSVQESEKPPEKPIPEGTPFRIRVLTNLGAEDLSMSKSAAQSMAKELAIYLKQHGSP